MIVMRRLSVSKGVTPCLLFQCSSSHSTGLSGPSKPRGTSKSAQIQPALGVKRRKSDSSETIRIVRIVSY